MIKKDNSLYRIFLKKFRNEDGGIIENGNGKYWEDLYFDFSNNIYYYRVFSKISKDYNLDKEQLIEFLNLGKTFNGKEKISLRLEDSNNNLRGEVYYNEDGNITHIVFRQVIEPVSFFDNWKSHPNLIRLLDKTLDNRENILISGVPGTGKSTFLASIFYEANKNINGETLIKKILNEKVFTPENIKYDEGEDIDIYLKTLKKLKDFNDDQLELYIQSLLNHPILDFYEKHFINKVLLTIENPIEYYYKKGSIKILQNETNNFKDAVYKTLRSNPDLLFIQEIKTTEEYNAFLQTGMNGIPTLSTNHSGNVFKNLEKIVNSQDDKNIKNNIINSISLLINFKRYKNKEGIFLLSYEMLYLSEEVSTIFLVEKNFNIFENNVKNSEYLDGPVFDNNGKLYGKPVYTSHLESLIYTLYIHYAKTGKIIELTSGIDTFLEVKDNPDRLLNIFSKLKKYYSLIESVLFEKFKNEFLEKYIN